MSRHASELGKPKTDLSLGFSRECQHLNVTAVIWVMILWLLTLQCSKNCIVRKLALGSKKF